MTFHSAKGLEFPVCFLIGVEDHIIPHEKSMQQTGIERGKAFDVCRVNSSDEALVYQRSVEAQTNGCRGEERAVSFFSRNSERAY